MKHFISFSIIFVFAALAIFAPMFFYMDSNHAGNCIIPNIDGAACPINIVDCALHYISSLQQSFIVTVASPLSNYAFLFALFSLVFIFIPFKNLTDTKLVFLPTYLKITEFNFHQSRKRLIRWLSLFEFSPNF